MNPHAYEYYPVGRDGSRDGPRDGRGGGGVGYREDRHPAGGREREYRGAPGSGGVSGPGPARGSGPERRDGGRDRARSDSGLKRDGGEPQSKRRRH